MIIQEAVTINDKQFKHTFSDANYYIQKEGTEEEKLQKELSLIDFDEASYFYRRNSLIDKVGAPLGITAY